MPTRSRGASTLTLLLACAPASAPEPAPAPAPAPAPDVAQPPGDPSPGDAVPSLSPDAAMKPYVLFPGTPADRLKWNFFYRDGTPEIARELLATFGRALPAINADFAADDRDKQERAATTLFHGLVFFIRAAERRRELVRVYEDYAREASGDEMQFLSKVLQHLGDARTLALLRELATKHGVDASGAALGPLPGFDDKLRAPVAHMADLDMRWANFFADGDPARIAEIVAVLGTEDRLRKHLAPLLAPQKGLLARLSGKAKGPQRLVEALRPLGFHFDPTTNAILDPEDLDLFAMTDGAELSSPRFKAFVDALPDKLPGELVLHMATKASALWSLANNASEHDAVLAVCQAEARRPDGPARLAVLTVLAAAHEQRGEFAAARAAVQELLERSPARDDLRRRAAALAVEEQFAALAQQPADAKAVDLSPEEGAAIARRAAERLARATAYHARAEFTLRGEPATAEQPTRSQWQGRFAGGRSQVMRALWTRASEEGLADEWLDIGATRYMRGPGIWLKVPPDLPRVGESSTLAYDVFAGLLARAPDRARGAAAGLAELVYDSVDAGERWTEFGAPAGPARVRLRVDRASGWLVGARVEVGDAPTAVIAFRFVAPEQPFTIEAPDAIDMTAAKPAR